VDAGEVDAGRVVAGEMYAGGVDAGEGTSSRAVAGAPLDAASVASPSSGRVDDPAKGAGLGGVAAAAVVCGADGAGEPSAIVGALATLVTVTEPPSARPCAAVAGAPLVGTVKLAGSSWAGASVDRSGVGDGWPRIAISAASAAAKPSTAFAGAAAPSLADAAIVLVTWAEAASMRLWMACGRVAHAAPEHSGAPSNRRAKTLAGLTV